MSDFANARKNMVDCQIHTSGVVDASLLNAFSVIPREKFVPANLQAVAYADECLPVGGGRFLLEPATHAKMVQAAAVQAHETALDIGGATGYPAAVLAALARQVVALETGQELAAKASALWAGLGIGNIQAVYGPLAMGAPEYASYDVIMLNGSVAQIPETLAAQLSETGRLLAILRPAGQIMGNAVIAKKTAGGGLSVYPLFEAGAPYLPGFEPKEAFSF